MFILIKMLRTMGMVYFHMFFFMPSRYIETLKHRHQRCKAPSLCKTIFIANIGQMKYFFFTTTLLQGLSHNGFFTTSFSQRLSHVFFTPLSLHILPHNVVLTPPQYMRNLSVLYICPKISQIRLSSVPCNFNILESIKLKPRRCTSAIYILSLSEVSEQRLHTKVPRTNYCTSNVNRRTNGRTDRRTDGLGDSNSPQPNWLAWG